MKVREKQFAAGDLGSITVRKHPRAKHLRIALSPSGTVRVTIPAYLPYTSGLAFARAKQQWIQTHRPRSKRFEDDDIRGQYTIRIKSGSEKLKYLIRNNEIIIFTSQSESDEAVQERIRSILIEQWRSDAVAHIPARVKAIAEQHGLEYNRVAIKNMSSRWGSCSEKKNINISLYIMQLPDKLIDYILAHELCHTKVLNHSPEFWTLLESIEPSYKTLRKELKQYSPNL